MPPPPAPRFVSGAHVRTDVPPSARRARRTPRRSIRPVAMRMDVGVGDGRDRRTANGERRRGRAGASGDVRAFGRHASRAARRLPHRSTASRTATRSPEGGNFFAQIGAIGLVRREIGRPRGKFFLACVQAAKAAAGALRRRAATVPVNAPRATPAKKRRVFPMFFFMRLSGGRSRRRRRRRAAAIVRACRCRAAAATAKKKLREGVDTLKNRD